MAAADTYIRAALRPGDHLILPDDAYGGTFRLVDKICVPWGLTYSTVPLGDLDAVRAAIRPTTRVIWCETPTNPLLGIADIAALAEIAHACRRAAVGGQHVRLALPAAAVGARAPTSCCTRPPSTSAAIPTSSAARWSPTHVELAEALAFHSKSMGAVPGPVDSWLTLRGLRTLAVRMDRHCDNAERVVDLLVGHPRVGRVYYPGLPGAPGPRCRRPTDAPVRRHGVVQRGRRAGGGAQGLPADQAVHARRSPSAGWSR